MAGKVGMLQVCERAGHNGGRAKRGDRQRAEGTASWKKRCKALQRHRMP